MVEFALLSSLAMIVMLVGVQYALLGQAMLAVSQGASAIARYAAVNSAAAVGGKTGNGTITLNGTALQNLLSPTICGGSCSNLTATIVSNQGNTNTPDTTTPAFGDTAIVTLSFDAQSAGTIALPNPFFGLPTFPKKLVATDSQMYEW